jgi:crotonobetainyl-CoA:carnitine CoA-transferase CaiB-like acyl-CoA transferase
VAADLPLHGVRILAFTQLGAGPFGMMMLADLGAEVVKEEHPATGGDEARTVPPFADPDAHDGLYYQAFNRGTRSITLDVGAPAGHALLRRLVPRFDAVFNNLRGDLTARLGLDHAALGGANPAERRVQASEGSEGACPRMGRLADRAARCSFSR